MQYKNEINSFELNASRLNLFMDSDQIRYSEDFNENYDLVDDKMPYDTDRPLLHDRRLASGKCKLCDKEAKVKGYCINHYVRFHELYRYGQDVRHKVVKEGDELFCFDYGNYYEPNIDDKIFMKELLSFCLIDLEEENIELINSFLNFEIGKYSKKYKRTEVWARIKLKDLFKEMNDKIKKSFNENGILDFIFKERLTYY